MSATSASRGHTRNDTPRPPEMPSVAFREIALDTLDRPEGFFALPPHPVPTIVPIAVCREAGGRHTILDGCKRHAALLERGVERFQCAVADIEAGDPAYGMLRIMLNMNRSRTIRETAFFVRWLRDHTSPDRLDSTAEALGFSRRELHDTLLLLGCHPAAVGWVQNGTIDRAVLGLFAALSAEQQHSFVAAFDGLRLSLQTQREFLQWLPEISSREGTSVLKIVGDPGIAEIVGDTGINGPQKIERIRREFHARRFPLLSRTERAWTVEAWAANPDPARITFAHSPGFERNRLEIRIAVATPGEARRIGAALASVPEETWQKLIRPTCSA